MERDKFGSFVKGSIPFNKGKKLSEKEKGRLDMRGLQKGWGYFKGKKRPEISGKNNPNGGKFGKDHPCYKENKKHPLYKAIRETFKYRQWRSDVFTRDDFTCVLCGVSKVYLEADHYPKRFIDIIREYRIKTLEEALNCEELWNINNGRTLCLLCHRKTDTWGRRKD